MINLPSAPSVPFKVWQEERTCAGSLYRCSYQSPRRRLGSNFSLTSSERTSATFEQPDLPAKKLSTSPSPGTEAE
eukprot:CAMPEP_0206463876 /NCGR_PEP_ID=MMETSP0324_2-20121206/26876_1 /ASSEMBLY_ACC=CAM_ASM_000836 /TAXON_ID=2866 /ORGANISM="Crypthecodinium cohnii, Strain Seligo" /LENGTH=74 /DNA_ID=CAMNT_0053936389 /DNA_START=109 /DNA_END=333 /DNA_ORIENTATION=-